MRFVLSRYVGKRFADLILKAAHLLSLLDDEGNELPVQFLEASHH